MEGIGKQLMQWLTDHADAVKTVAAYVASLISSIAALLKLRQARKRLSYSWEWLAPSKLGVAARDAYRNLRGPEPKERVRALIVRLWNAGQLAIEREDFDAGSPLELYFDPNRLDGAVVAFAREANSTPESLNPIVTSASDHSVLIQPLLLNSGDEIRVEAVLRGPLRRSGWLQRLLRRLLSVMSPIAPPNAIRIRARVTGVSDPRWVRFPVVRMLLPPERRRSAARQLRLLGGLATIASVLYLTFLASSVLSRAVVSVPPTLTCMEHVVVTADKRLHVLACTVKDAPSSETSFTLHYTLSDNGRTVTYLSTCDGTLRNGTGTCIQTYDEIIGVFDNPMPRVFGELLPSRQLLGPVTPIVS